MDQLAQFRYGGRCCDSSSCTYRMMLHRMGGKRIQRRERVCLQACAITWQDWSRRTGGWCRRRRRKRRRRSRGGLISQTRLAPLPSKHACSYILCHVCCRVCGVRGLLLLTPTKKPALLLWDMMSPDVFFSLLLGERFFIFLFFGLVRPGEDSLGKSVFFLIFFNFFLGGFRGTGQDIVMVE